MIRIRNLKARRGAILYSTNNEYTAVGSIGLWDEVSLTHQDAGTLWVVVESIQLDGLYAGSIKSIGVPGVDRLRIGVEIQFYEEFIQTVVMKG